MHPGHGLHPFIATRNSVSACSTLWPKPTGRSRQAGSSPRPGSFSAPRLRLPGALPPSGCAPQGAGRSAGAGGQPYFQPGYSAGPLRPSGHHHHYLAKETMQSVVMLRFANVIFKPLWNHNYIDHVSIPGFRAPGGEASHRRLRERRGSPGHVPESHDAAVVPMCLGAAILLCRRDGARRENQNLRRA
ncbi:hypothetical protein DFAR_930004 [Desulfarculales bacterium]